MQVANWQIDTDALIANIKAQRYKCLSRYLINTYVRYLSYALLIIAELPND